MTANDALSAAEGQPYAELQRQIHERYAHSTWSGLSPTVILQPVTLTSRGSPSFCASLREPVTKNAP